MISSYYFLLYTLNREDSLLSSLKWARIYLIFWQDIGRHPNYQGTCDPLSSFFHTLNQVIILMPMVFIWTLVAPLKKRSKQFVKILPTNSEANIWMKESLVLLFMILVIIFISLEKISQEKIDYVLMDENLKMQQLNYNITFNNIVKIF